MRSYSAWNRRSGVAWPRPQPALELSHFVRGHTPAGVVGTGLAGHALALTSATGATKAGALPSRGVMLRRHRRYYGPLGLPLRTPRFRLGLIRARLPRRRPRRRVSRVQHSSLHACCAPYPAGTHGAFRFWRRGPGLRRDMSGSASRIVHLSRLQASLDVAARVLAPFPRASPLKAFDGRLRPPGSLPISPRPCYPALRRLPGRDSHPLEKCREQTPVSSPTSVCVTAHHVGGVLQLRRSRRPREVDQLVALLKLRARKPMQWHRPNDVRSVKRLVRKLKRRGRQELGAATRPTVPCGFGSARTRCAATGSAPAWSSRRRLSRASRASGSRQTGEMLIKLAELFRAELLTRYGGHPPTKRSATCAAAATTVPAAS